MPTITPKIIRNKRAWYIVTFVLLGAMSIAACWVNEAPRVADPNSNLSNADIAWMLTSSALVLLMTPGVAFFYGGMVGSKNVISTMLQSFATIGVISILWVVVGFSLAFGDDSNMFIGKPWTYWMFHNVGGQTNAALSPTIPLALYAIFQMMFAVITPALISGGLAERIRFPAFITFISLWSLLVYCPLAHWTWHPQGFLRVWGVLDFAGGTVVHMSSGWAALAGAIVLGRRKVHKDKAQHVPANVPFVILGASLLWFGWFGFNAGSALTSSELATIAFLTTNTATAMASITWIIFDAVQGKKPSAVGACTGAVVGLVVITPGSGYVSVQSSFFIGFCGAVVCNLACWIKGKTTLDDTLDAFSCHGVGGMTGIVLTGFFADYVGVTAGTGRTFGFHWAALCVVACYVFGMSFILFKFLELFMPLRVDEFKEEQGLDATQHGESVYDFRGLDSTITSQQGLNPHQTTGLMKDSRRASGVGFGDDYQPPPLPINTDNNIDHTEVVVGSTAGPTPASSPNPISVVIA